MLFWTLLISVAFFCNGDMFERIRHGGPVNVAEQNKTCPESYEVNEKDLDQCIKVWENPKMTFTEAREACAKDVEGGDLVHIQDMDSNKFVAGLLTKGRRYWMGIKRAANNRSSSASDSDATAVWSYTDGTFVAAVMEAPWARGEPNNRPRDERCVEMIANPSGAWNDKRCSRKRPFICQAKSLQRSVVSTLAVGSSSYNPDVKGENSNGTPRATTKLLPPSH